MSTPLGAATLATLMQQIPVGLFAIKEAALVWCNDVFGELCECPPERIAGQGFVGLVAPEDRAFVVDRYRRRLAGEDVPNHYEFSLLGLVTGRRTAIHMTAVVSVVEEIRYSIGAVVDVSAQAQIAAGLRAEATGAGVPATPVLRVAAGVLVVPLVGHYHAARIQGLTEDVLAAIQQHRANALILDVTGLLDADTRIADYLPRTAAAARLLGTRCVVAGISPALARALVSSAGALADVASVATLEDALRLVRGTD